MLKKNKIYLKKKTNNYFIELLVNIQRCVKKKYKQVKKKKKIQKKKIKGLYEKFFLFKLNQRNPSPFTIKKKKQKQEMKRKEIKKKTK